MGNGLEGVAVSRWLGPVLQPGRRCAGTGPRRPRPAGRLAGERMARRRRSVAAPMRRRRTRRAAGGDHAGRRAALAAMWWSQKHRRGPEAETAIRAITAGLSEAEQGEWKSLLLSGALDSMSEEELLAGMFERAGKNGMGEHKIAATERKIAPTATLDPPTAVDAGTFTGYLAAVGTRDRQGDTIQPGALDATVAEFTAGRQRWLGHRLA